MKNVSSRTSSLKMRLMSALTSIMTLLTVAVPSMTTTVSATDLTSLSGKPTTDVELLAGEGNILAEGASNASDVISNADRTYLIGIASQFCVFLHDDFTVKNADAEGRVAIGGNFAFENGWNYQIGSGDFATGTPLEKLTNINGQSIYYKNAAHFIMAGDRFKNLNVKSNTTGEPYKIFAVGQEFDLDKCSYLWDNAYNEDYIFKADLIDFDAEFAKLNATTQKLEKQKVNGTAEWDGNTLNLTCNDSSAKVVYFNVENWNEAVDAINYIDIPEGAFVVVSCDDASISIKGNVNKVQTTINGEIISNQPELGHKSNNNVNSERILYNFPNASTVYIDANFNGTILAPNADASSDDACNGHLSGALIAKSFTGGLEFGYRPYQGSIDMIKASLGYPVPVQKFDMDQSGLAGATFELVDSATNNSVSGLKSTGNIDYLDVPTKIDFSGDTDYTEESSRVISSTYTLKEKSAPSGYKKTDKTYQLAVTETITDVDSNGVPTAISVSLTVTGEENYNQQFVIDSIKDQYDADGNITDRTILIQDGNDDVLFHVLYTAGKASSVTTGNDAAVEGIDVTKSGSFTLNDKTYYYDASNALVMPTIDAMTFENEEVGALVKLEKVDQYQTNLNGAVVEIYAQDGTKIASNVSLDRQDGNLIEIGKVVDAAYATKAGTLKPGVYYLVETEAPSGATLVSDKQYFKVNEDGTLTVPYVLPVIQPTSYEISQIALTNYDESAITVESIVIYHADGSTSTASISSGGNYDWTQLDLGSASTSDVTGIEVTASGDGSANITTQDRSWQNINALCGTFSAGTTLIGEKPVTEEPTEPVISLNSDNTIQFQNYVEEEGPVIQISKRDAVGSEEVAGAMLKLTGKDGLDLSDVVISGGATVPAGPSQDKSTIIWESGETPAALKNLPDGEPIPWKKQLHQMAIHW